MDLFDLFFRTGPALQVLFKLGYMPKDEEFYEMTYQQYQHYFDMYGHTDEKIYLLLPEDQKKYTELAAGDAFCAMQPHACLMCSAKIRRMLKGDWDGIKEPPHSSYANFMINTGSIFSLSYRRFAILIEIARFPVII